MNGQMDGKRGKRADGGGSSICFVQHKGIGVTSGQFPKCLKLSEVSHSGAISTWGLHTEAWSFGADPDCGVFIL